MSPIERTAQEENLIAYLGLSASLTSPDQSYADWKFNNLETLVAHYGTVMRSAPDSNIDTDFAKQCYQNSQSALETYPDLIYCEGYAVKHSLGLPCLHGWLIDRDKQVIDSTWEEPASYIGIAFDKDWFVNLLSHRKRRDCIAILENNYLEQFSFLKDGLPSDAVHPVMN